MTGVSEDVVISTTERSIVFSIVGLLLLGLSVGSMIKSK